MFPTDRLNQIPLEIPSRADVPKAFLGSLEGTLQRVNYRTRELTLVTQGRLWRFDVTEDCTLWFDGRQANFRCFQPLDHLRIFFEVRDGRRIAQALYGWAPQATPANPIET